MSEPAILAAPAADDGIKMSNDQIEEPTTRGRRRHVWGPIPSTITTTSSTPQEDIAPSSTNPPAKRRRRSRWDTSTDHDAASLPTTLPTSQPQDGTSPLTAAASQALVLFPSEIILSNGIKINLPPALTGKHPSGDPEVIRLHTEYANLERKHRSGIVDIPPDHERSPSPPPIYDSNGVRQNTREVRYKERQVKKRNRIIEELLKVDSLFKPPADYRPEKKVKKIYIPYKQYPDYNFIGLIIGPRGNTQKQMQADTNTKIAIRGRGALKGGTSKETKYDYGEDEELHVMITGDTDEDVNAASLMIEKLLEPMEEGMSDHKQKQLRELALINGTLKEESTYCYLCGDSSHGQMDCPKKAMDVYRLPDAIQLKVEEQYARDVARMNPNEGIQQDDEYRSFLAELGGTDPRSIPNEDSAGIQHRGLGSRPGLGSGVGVGVGMTKQREDDGSIKLWVGNIPQSMDSNALRSLFQPYGLVTYSQIRMDSESGLSRGFGFIHYQEESAANAAIEKLNGMVMQHGKPLVVKRKSESGVTPGSGSLGASGANTMPLSTSSTPLNKQPQQRPEDGFPPECKIYIGQIPHHVDESMLKQEFEKYGSVIAVRFIFDKETKRPKGYAFVTMREAHAAHAAIIGMHGYPYFDVTMKPLVVRQAGVFNTPSSQQPYQQPYQHQQFQQQQPPLHGYNAVAPPPSLLPPPLPADPMPPLPPNPYQQQDPYQDPYYHQYYAAQQQQHHYYYGAGAGAAVPPAGVGAGAVQPPSLLPPPPPPPPQTAYDYQSVDGGEDVPPPPPPPPEEEVGAGVEATAPESVPNGAAEQQLSEYERFMAEMAKSAF